MTLPRFAVDNASFTSVVLLALGLMGLVSFFTMPRSEDPQFDLPTISVRVIFPGAGPDDIESLVVDPLEEEINALDDIDRIETTIQDGFASLTVDFVLSADGDAAEEDVLRAVAGARSSFPSEVRDVSVSRFSPTNVAILQFAVISDTAAYRTLEREAERVADALERVAGLREADVWAFPAQEIQIDLDAERLRTSGVRFDQVIEAVQTAARNVPGGEVDLGERRFTVRSSGDFETLDQIRRTVILGTGTRMVRLGDVARVARGTDETTYHARFNGQRGVLITAEQREGENIFDVMEGVDAELARLRGSMAPGVQLETMFVQAESVDRRIGGFFESLLQGVVLVGLVMLLALGFRAAVVVMLSVPLSILLAIGAVDFSGYGLQQISIVGLVIALGLLVDDAIVITENVARYRREGFGRRAAALKGTQEVGYAVISTSLTSILAFLPIVLIESGSGQFIRSMPVTVIYTLLASLLVALTLVPLLSSRFLGAGEREGGRAGEGQNGSVAEGEDEPATPNPQPPTRQGGILQPYLARLTDGPYRRALGWSLAHPWIVLAIAGATFVGSLALFPLVGVTLFPSAEKPQFLVTVTTPEGSSLSATDRAVARVEKLLAGRDDVRRYASNIGRDNPIVYYNEVPRGERVTHGQLFVEATAAEAVPRLVDDLRAALADVPGVDYDFSIFKNGPPVEAPIAIKVIGPDLDVLTRLADATDRQMRATPGTANVDNPLAEPKTDLRVSIDRDEAGMRGVQIVDIDRTVRAAMAGLTVGTFRDAAGDDLDLVVRLPRETERPQMSDFDRMTVPSRTTGATLPLRQLADLRLERVPSQIDHFDTERAVTVTADAREDEGYTVVAVTQAVVERLEALDLPPGYRLFVGGELEEQSESFGSLGVALIGAVMGILAVLVLQFGSIRQPVIIFTAVPLAVIGAIPALLVTGYTFSFTAFVGFTSLVGIVVNTSTILVDYANQLREEGLSITEAVTKSSLTRFAPILLTACTTIGGLLPLTLTGSSLWTPLGLVIIGGLVASTALTLLVVPVLYVLLTAEEAAA